MTSQEKYQAGQKKKKKKSKTFKNYEINKEFILKEVKNQLNNA